MSSVGTAEGATAFSLFRVNDTVCAPDPATPDLTLQMFGRADLPFARCNFARGRFDMKGTPGVFSVSPAFTDCDYAGEGAFELLILSMPHETFAPLVAEATNGTAPEPDVLHSRAWSDPAVTWLMHRLFACCEAPEAAHARLVLEGGATMLVGELMRLAGSPLPDVRDRSRLSGPAMSRIEEHVHEHLAGPIGVEELARLAGCSRYHFSRLFLRTTGETPQRYVTRHRVERAATLLTTTELSVDAIAHRVGFGAGRALAKSMRRLLGASPNEVRGSVRAPGSKGRRNRTT